MIFHDRGNPGKHTEKYIERADKDGAPQQNSDDNQGMPCNVCTGIIREKEGLSANNDKLMELANCHQKETVQDVKLGILGCQPFFFSFGFSHLAPFFRYSLVPVFLLQAQPCYLSFQVLQLFLIKFFRSHFKLPTDKKVPGRAPGCRLRYQVNEKKTELGKKLQF